MTSYGMQQTWLHRLPARCVPRQDEPCSSSRMDTIDSEMVQRSKWLKIADAHRQGHFGDPGDVRRPRFCLLRENFRTERSRPSLYGTGTATMPEKGVGGCHMGML